jgi:hypothetical protein
MARFVKTTRMKYYTRSPHQNYVLEIKVGEKLVHNTTGASLIFIKSTPKGWNFYSETFESLLFRERHLYETKEFGFKKDRSLIYIEIPQATAVRFMRYYGVDGHSLDILS